jgi:plasmid stabilization system protein ParE
MSFTVRISKHADANLRRIFAQRAAKDIGAAKRARLTIYKSMELLKDFPFTCRKAQPESLHLRELVIPYGHYGFVALFKIENRSTVVVLAIRHQREEEFH